MRFTKTQNTSKKEIKTLTKLLLIPNDVHTVDDQQK